MTAGRPRPDLGRIEHDAAFVSPRCDCGAIPQYRTSKAKALRLARTHVASTGHTVTLWIEHWQTVNPR
jgi:hypothetical protein